MSTEAIETPSGKNADTENFPVGSFLLPRRLRPHVARYYRFARAIDDIADNPDLSPEEKIIRLEKMDDAVRGISGEDDPALATAHALRETLDETGVDTAHASDLVSAFKQDAVKKRYESWEELMDYCDRSAAPVGRFLIELHGCPRVAFPYSDALCNALQVINHLQDCADDFAELDRVYLPRRWLDLQNESVEALSRPESSAGLRAVIDQCLRHSKELMQQANHLAPSLSHKGLAMESAVIVNIAWQLIEELSRRDPLAERVKLTRLQLASCGISGVLNVLFKRHTRQDLV